MRWFDDKTMLETIAAGRMCDVIGYLESLSADYAG